MFRIENGWVSSLYDEFKVWISIMFVFDLENLGWFRMIEYDIWIVHSLAVLMIYSLLISGKFWLSVRRNPTGEDDRSYISDVWCVPRVYLCGVHMCACVFVPLALIALTDPRVLLTADDACQLIKEMQHFRLWMWSIGLLYARSILWMRIFWFNLNFVFPSILFCYSIYFVHLRKIIKNGKNSPI